MWSLSGHARAVGVVSCSGQGGAVGVVVSGHEGLWVWS